MSVHLKEAGGTTLPEVLEAGDMALRVIEFKPGFLSEETHSLQEIHDKLPEGAVLSLTVEYSYLTKSILGRSQVQKSRKLSVDVPLGQLRQKLDERLGS